MLFRSIVVVVCLILSGNSVPGQQPEQDAADSDSEKELLSGKVLTLGEALKKREIRFADEVKDQVVLETEAGALIPILADWRGRAFFQDERLRSRKVELIGSRKPGIPYLQVLMVFTFNDKGERLYTDYWCDICSIPMYEIKPCDCCQGDVRLRFQSKDLPDWLNSNRSSSGKKPVEAD